MSQRACDKREEIDPDGECLEKSPFPFADEVDNQTVQQESVGDGDIEPVTAFAGVDICCRNIKDNRDEVVQDDDYDACDDGESENVAMDN